MTHERCFPVNNLSSKLESEKESRNNKSKEKMSVQKQETLAKGGYSFYFDENLIIGKHHT